MEVSVQPCFHILSMHSMSQTLSIARISEESKHEQTTGYLEMPLIRPYRFAIFTLDRGIHQLKLHENLLESLGTIYGRPYWVLCMFSGN